MGVCQDSRLCAEVEMSKIMELADSMADDYFTNGLHRRIVDKTQEETRTALAAEVQAEQDYTCAVISERDAWKESAEEQVMLLNQIANERDALRKAAQMALKWIEAVNEPGLGGSNVAKALRKELGQ
jgi:hypothetical protein